MRHKVNFQKSVIHINLFQLPKTSIVVHPINLGQIFYYELGNNLYKLRSCEKALIAYEQAIQLDPDDDRAYIGKGKALYTLGRYLEARDAYYAKRTQLMGKCIPFSSDSNPYVFYFN